MVTRAIDAMIDRSKLKKSQIIEKKYIQQENRQHSGIAIIPTERMMDEAECGTQPYHEQVGHDLSHTTILFLQHTEQTDRSRSDRLVGCEINDQRFALVVGYCGCDQRKVVFLSAHFTTITTELLKFA